MCVCVYNRISCISSIVQNIHIYIYIISMHVYIYIYKYMDTWIFLTLPA